MKFNSLPPFTDVYRVIYDYYSDERGLFFESYKSSTFKEKIPYEFVQDNQSLSQKNVFRGLHFQKFPYEQGKFISVMSGSILDIVADIREESLTYGKVAYVHLSANQYDSLWIPPGFAHGFLSLEDDTRVFYKVSKEYSKEHEVSLSYLDPLLAIQLPIAKDKIIISEKDEKAIFLNTMNKKQVC